MSQSVTSHTKHLSFVSNIRYLLSIMIVQRNLLPPYFEMLRTMMLPTKPFLMHLTILSLLQFTGCLKTVVPLPEEDKNVARLLDTAHTRAICHYSTNVEDPDLNSAGSRGNQYFMGVVPFGSISTPSGADLIQHYLRQEGGILGFQCLQESNEFRSPLLLISVDEISLSGYDFIFFRKPSASLILRGDLYDSGPHGLLLKRSCKSNSDEYELRQYAFSRELARVFDAAWRNVMRDLMQCILRKEPN